MDHRLPPDREGRGEEWQVLTPETAALVRRCQTGDRQAFSELMRLFDSPVMRFARTWFDDPRDAEDATVEVFIRLYHSLPALRDPRCFLSFLFGLARNVCIRQLERQQRQRIQERPIQEWLLARPGRSGRSDRVVPGPEEELQRQEIRTTIRRAIQSLAASEREPFLLHYEEQFTYEQIAEMFGIPRETVRYRVRQARRRLAALLPPDLLQQE